LQIKVLVFSKVLASIKSGIFSGGNSPSFGFLKIGSCFWFKKFLFKFTQVSKIGFVVFSQVFGKQVVSFGKVRFFWLASFWSGQALKIGYIFSAKVSASLGQAFSPGSFSLAKQIFRKVSF
jgi:hypothetical protein